MGDVFIHRVALPPKVNGLVVKRNDDYIVFVNETLSEKAQHETVKHELGHLKKVHLEQDILSAAECESEINPRRGEL